MKLADKIRTIAQKIYRAADIAVPDAVARRLEGFEDAGFGDVPVCIAKTQYSFTADPTVMGAPEGFVLPVREVRLSAGAGFVVAICGDIMTMPGLPRVPSPRRSICARTARSKGCSSYRLCRTTMSLREAQRRSNLQPSAAH